MIHIQKNEFDFQAEQEAFVQTLYGGWDAFHRTAFEKVVEEVLSRYDPPDEWIRIETLDLDLGTLAETDFYEQFPRVLARKLDEAFAACLARRESHPEDIQVIPIKQSCVDKFVFYLLNGYLPWDEENRPWVLSDLLAEIIHSDATSLLRWLRAEGGRLAVRERLVFQLSDTDLQRLTPQVVPSDAPFIHAYVRFLVDSHQRLHRPHLTAQDYRNGVWFVVWTYLLAESKGYYSRKQLILYTLRELSARYAIPFETLLEWLTAGLQEWTAVRGAIPELLLILADINEERKTPVEEISADRHFSSKELSALLSRPGAFRHLFKDVSEEGFYVYVRQAIPSEQLFVIRYAQALEKEKERGMLEGKAGEEFRLVKWEFIFVVILHAPAGTFSRLQFVYSVLQRLAAHYGLRVIDLLSYFYRSLASGEVRADSRIKEVIYALFLEYHALSFVPDPSSSQRVPGVFPADVKETLADIHLCRLFLRPLPEEKIYRLVEGIIPAESPFIVQYARFLDQGKDRNALEGKAGEEFRILKWEFIFLFLFGAPLSYFSRKRFARSVLQQLAAHYNLTAADLILFFYKQLQTEEGKAPFEIREIIFFLYEEMEKESPESLLTQRVSGETARFRLEKLIREGRIESAADSISADDLYRYVRQISRTAPTVLMEIIETLREAPTAVREVKPAGCGRVFAFLLHFAIRYYGLAFSRKGELVKLLEEIETRRRSGNASLLRLLLYYCLQDRMPAFQKMLDELLLPSGNASPAAEEEIEKEPGKGSAEKAAEAAEIEAAQTPEQRTEGDGKKRFEENAIENQREKAPGQTGKRTDRETGEGKLVGAVEKTARAQLVPREDERTAPGFREPDKEATTATITVTAMATGIEADGEAEKKDACRTADPMVFPYHRLQKQASAALRSVIEDVLYILSLLRTQIEESVWVSLLVDLADGAYRYYSRAAFLQLFWDRIKDKLTVDQQQLVWQTVRTHRGVVPAWEEVLKKEEQTVLSAGEKPESVSVYVRNAGLMLLAPFFPRLFDKMDLLDEKKRLSERASKIKAIYAMQYLATGEEKLPEYELFLNKLLTGYEPENSFPAFDGIEEKDRQVLVSLLDGVRQNWSQMKNTSVEGFRTSFLRRDGVLEEQEDYWLLTVDPRAYDLLLDTLPWSYSPVKFQWMTKPVYVKWI